MLNLIRFVPPEAPRAFANYHVVRYVRFNYLPRVTVVLFNFSNILNYVRSTKTLSIYLIIGEFKIILEETNDFTLLYRKKKRKETQFLAPIIITCYNQYYLILFDYATHI